MIERFHLGPFGAAVGLSARLNGSRAYAKMVFLTTRPRKRVANQASLPDRAAHPSRAPFACSKLQDFTVKQLVISAKSDAHKLSPKGTLRKGGTNGRHYGRLELVCGAAVIRHGHDRNLFGWLAPRQAEGGRSPALLHLRRRRARCDEHHGRHVLRRSDPDPHAGR